MTLPVIVIGAGGHAKVLLDALQLGAVEVLGVVDADPAKTGAVISGVPVIGADDRLAQYPAAAARLVNGIGSIGAGSARGDLFERFKQKGYRFADVRHPAAVIAADAVLGEGAQIMAGAVIQAGCRIGSNVIVNTRAAVDHDCRIGDHVHIAPGATLSGGVTVGDHTHIGSGATVIQGITIGSRCLVAAGAVVIHDVPDGTAVAGVPAREMVR